MFYYAVALECERSKCSFFSTSFTAAPIRSSKIRVPLKKAQQRGRIETLLSQELIVKTDRSQEITQVICKPKNNCTSLPLIVSRARANALLAVLASHRKTRYF